MLSRGGRKINIGIKDRRSLHELDNCEWHTIWSPLSCVGLGGLVFPLAVGREGF